MEWQEIYKILDVVFITGFILINVAFFGYCIRKGNKKGKRILDNIENIANSANSIDNKLKQ